MRAALVLVAIALAGCGSRTAAPAATTTTAAVRPISVTLTWHFKPPERSGIGRGNNEPNAPCGIPEYRSSQWTPDAWNFPIPGDAVLKDGHGVVLGTASFGPGMTSGLKPDNQFDCSWDLGFSTAPVADFYTLTVGSKDLLTFSGADIENHHGDIEATIQH